MRAVKNLLAVTRSIPTGVPSPPDAFFAPRSAPYNGGSRRRVPLRISRAPSSRVSRLPGPAMARCSSPARGSWCRRRASLLTHRARALRHWLGEPVAHGRLGIES